MEMYLVIITTVLVITQVIRITQNTLSLKKQNKLINKQLESISDITNEDIEKQRKAYDAIIEFVHVKEK